MSEKNCYHDFDTLLLIDWVKASNGDLTRLRISGGSDELDIEAWEKIAEQHSEEFGVDRKHAQYLRLMKKRSLYQLDLIIKEDPFIQNHIDIVEEEITALLKQIASTGGNSIMDTCFALSERAGYSVTESNITAKNFFGMIKYYSKKD